MIWANDPEDLELSIEKKSGDKNAFYILMEDLAKSVGALYLGHSEVKANEDEPPISFEISFAFMCAADRDLFAERARMTFPDENDVTIRGLPEE